MKNKKISIAAGITILMIYASGCAANAGSMTDMGTTTKVSASDSKDSEEITAGEDTEEVFGISEAETEAVEQDVYEYDGITYKVIQVDGGDRSGSREAEVAVDIGFGDRVYWGLTNEYGQLVYVIADKIILQDDRTEPITKDGRYYDDEAYVPGTEESDLDQGHVIADSLGGVSNAYNITPQNSTLNRNGDQAYMEKVIRDANGCTNFLATITYPDTVTQIPSSYKYQYTINGYEVTDEFPNENPEKKTSVTAEESSTESSASLVPEDSADATGNMFDEEAELEKIDTNGNGQVTIAEAKAAGYSMPVYENQWIYKYMDDRDGDGMVGE